MSTKALNDLFINKNFCHEIIENYNRENRSVLTVEEFFIEPIKEVIGFLCDYYTLTIKCTEKLKGENIQMLKFFIKSLPAVNKNDERIKIFGKEKALYRYLLPYLLNYSKEIWLPRLYLCDDQLLVLEDLRESGFADCHNYLNLTDVGIFNILRSVAIMHSSSIVYEYYVGISIGKAFTNCLQEITLSSSVPWLSTGVKAIVELAKIHPKYKTNLECCKDRTLVGITEQELLQSYKEFQLFGLVYRFLALTILNVPRGIVNDHYKNVERSKQLMEYMHKNKEFRLLIFESLEDIVDFIIKTIE
uniref:CHK kinase-like domain-containing protein n=1 Tax=Glossina brevipalpis TaxID=37001 RepID=A0A1A9WZV0_9MUSC